MFSTAIRTLYRDAVGGSQREPPNGSSQFLTPQMWVDFGLVLLTDLSYAVSTKLPGPKALQILHSKWKQMFALQIFPLKKTSPPASK